MSSPMSRKGLEDKRLQSKVRQLEEELKEKLTTICTMESEKAELRKNIAYLTSRETTKSHLEERCRNLREELDGEKKKCADLQQECNRVRQDANATIGRWKDHHDALVMQIETMELQIASMRSELSSTTSKYDLERSRAGSVDRVLEETSKRLESAQGDALRFQRQAESLYGELSHTKTALLSSQRCFDEASQHHKAALAEIDAKGRQVADLDSKLSNANKLLEALRLELQTTRIAHMDTQSTLTSSERERLELVTKCTEQAAEIARLNDEAMKLANDFTAATSCQEGTRVEYMNERRLKMVAEMSLSTANDTIATLERQLAAAEGTIQNLTTSSNIASEEISELREEVQSLQRQLEIAHDEATRMQASEREALEVIAAQKRSLEDSIVNIDGLQSTVTEKDAVIAELSREVAALQTTLQAKGAQLEQVSIELNSAKAQSSQAMETCEQNSSTILSLQSQIDAMTAAALSQETALSDLRDQLRLKQEKEVAVSQELEDAQARIIDLTANVNDLTASSAQLSERMAAHQTKASASEEKLSTRCAQLEQDKNQLLQTVSELTSKCETVAKEAAQRIAVLTAEAEEAKGSAEEYENYWQSEMYQSNLQRESYQNAKKLAEQEHLKTLQAKEADIQRLQTSVHELTKQFEAERRDRYDALRQVQIHKNEADNAIHVKDKYKAFYNQTLMERDRTNDYRKLEKAMFEEQKKQLVQRYDNIVAHYVDLKRWFREMRDERDPNMSEEQRRVNQRRVQATETVASQLEADKATMLPLDFVEPPEIIRTGERLVPPCGEVVDKWAEKPSPCPLREVFVNDNDLLARKRSRTETS